MGELLRVTLEALDRPVTGARFVRMWLGAALCGSGTGACGWFRSVCRILPERVCAAPGPGMSAGAAIGRRGSRLERPGRSGGEERFGGINREMMDAVDQSDSARFSRNDILAPAGWALLSFLMDPRTGLGRFRDFRISNYELMMDLIDYCKDHTIQQVLALPDVAERVAIYNAHREKACRQITSCTS